MPGQSAQWVSAARLLRRVGFGVTGPAVDAVAAQGWSAYLDGALAGDPESLFARLLRTGLEEALA